MPGGATPPSAACSIPSLGMENGGRGKQMSSHFSPFPLHAPSSSFSSLADFTPPAGWTAPPALPSDHVVPGTATSKMAAGGTWSDSSSAAAAAAPAGVSPAGFRLVGGRRDQGMELGDMSVQVWSFCLPSMHPQSGLPCNHYQSNGTDPSPMTSAMDNNRHRQLENAANKHDCFNEVSDRWPQTFYPTRSSSSTRLSFAASGANASFHQDNLLPNALEQPQAAYEKFRAVWPSQVWIDSSSDETELASRGLVVLVQKELRKSDVSSLGRIVLPKDAEANLPILVEKEGVMMQMEDLSFPVLWTFKYRYWPNNKSRMYIMENTGDFIRMHGLQVGDLFIIYSGYEPGNYLVRGRKRPCPLPPQ